MTRAAADLAPVPPRAPDVLAQPERGVLQLRAAAAVPRALRRDLLRRPEGPQRDRARASPAWRDGGDVHRARLQHGRPARAGRAQADARHAAAVGRLPRRARRQRGGQHGRSRWRSSDRRQGAVRRRGAAGPVELVVFVVARRRLLRRRWASRSRTSIPNSNRRRPTSTRSSCRSSSSPASSTTPTTRPSSCATSPRSCRSRTSSTGSPARWSPARGWRTRAARSRSRRVDGVRHRLRHPRLLLGGAPQLDRRGQRPSGAAGRPGSSSRRGSSARTP